MFRANGPRKEMWVMQLRTGPGRAWYEYFCETRARPGPGMNLFAGMLARIVQTFLFGPNRAGTRGWIDARFS